MSLDPGVLTVLDGLEAQTDALVARISKRMRAIESEGVGYDSLDASDLRAAVEGNVSRALQALREERAPTDEELELAAAVGELRARQGFAQETVLRGVRIGALEALDATRGPAAEARVEVDSIIALAGALWTWVDEVSVAIAGGHRNVELAMARQDQQQRAAFLHGLVFGSLSTQKLTAGAAAYGLDLDAAHQAVRVRPTAEHPVESLERLLHPSRWSPGLVGVVDGDLAAILPREPAVEVPVPAGLGPPVQLAAMSRSFFLASRALETAIAFGRPGWRRLEDLSLRPGVLAEDHLGASLLERYVTRVRELGPFGEELLRSLRVYLDHDQGIEPAAQLLHVHPNTLRHRLARFEEITGASLRHVEHLAEIWWALARDELEERRSAS